MSIGEAMRLVGRGVFGALLLWACGCSASSQRPSAASATGFDFAGVIEGFYGTPWSHQDRLDIIGFMGTTALDTYVYAPKDDPFHLARWRDPYPPEQLQALEQLVDHASANGIRFWYAISPGLSMQYSSAEDYSALLRKIDAVAAIGIGHFGLFLDDVPLQLEQPDDRDQFGTLGEAHVYLINKLYTDLSARGFQLMVTPTVYTSAWDNPDYINRLGDEVNADVPLVWTGPDVATDRITATQSAEWSARLNRRIVLWDNYPVNDFAPWRVFLGPVRGRDERLPVSTAGILANPMNQAHASQIALRTLSDYVASPSTYNPDSSWQVAIREMFGAQLTDLRPVLDAFADYPSDTHVFEPLHFLRDTIDLRPIDRVLATSRAALEAVTADPNATQMAKLVQAELEPILSRARSRIEELRSSSHYLEVDGVLHYADAQERIVVSESRRAIEVDGNVDDWSVADWRPLWGVPSAEAAFTRSEQTMHIAIRVEAENIHGLQAPRLGEGPHVQLILDYDRSTNEITAEDLFVLIAPPMTDNVAPVFVGSMKLEGFMAKWLSDNEGLRLSRFHLTTFGIPPSTEVTEMAAGLAYGVDITPSGFTVEIAIPYRNQAERMSITASARVGGRLRTSSLARRNFPINPATFVTLIFP